VLSSNKLSKKRSKVFNFYTFFSFLNLFVTSKRTTLSSFKDISVTSFTVEADGMAFLFLEFIFLGAGELVLCSGVIGTSVGNFLRLLLRNGGDGGDGG